MTGVWRGLVVMSKMEGLWMWRVHNSGYKTCFASCRLALALVSSSFLPSLAQTSVSSPPMLFHAPQSFLPFP